MRVLAWVGGVLGLVVVLAVLAIAFPGLWLAPLVESRLQARLDRDVQVGDADLGLTPFKVTLTNLKVANPAWAEPPWLLDVARLEAYPRLGDVLSGGLGFKRWEVEHPAVHLVRHPQHGLSWSPQGEGGDLPVDSLVLSGGRLTYSAPARDTRVSGRFGSRPAQERLHVSLSGTWRGQPARLEGWTARLLDLRGADQVPVGFDLAVGDTTAVGQGTIRRLGAEGGPHYRISLDAAGPDLQAWETIAGATMPSSPPYHLRGDLSWDGERYAFRKAGGTIGESRVSGGIIVQPGPVTAVGGQIHAAHMEMADVFALGGGNGGNGGGAETGLLPDGLSLDLDVQARELVMPGQTLHDVDTHVALAGGRLTVEPFSASVAGRPVNGHLIVDDRTAAAPTAVDVALSGGRTNLSIDGTVTGRGLDLRVAASGPHLRLWEAVAGTDLPAAPAYDIQGRVTGTPQRIVFEDASATLGDSRLAGRLVVEPGAVTRVSGRIRAPHLVAADLMAVGGRNGAEDGEEGLLPSGLRLDLDVKVEELETPWRTVNDIDTHLALRDRRLLLEPFAASVGGGRVAGRLALDGAQAPSTLALSLDLKRLTMQDTLGRFEATEGGLTGLYGGRIDVTGPWQGLDGWLGGLDGSLRLAMSDGNLGTDVLKRAGFGLGDIFGGGGDQPTRIRCALMEASVSDGVLTSDRTVLSATSAMVTAEGTVDLGQRRLDLVLQVEPREGAGLTVVGPVAVTGSLTDPTVDAGAGPGVAKAAAGVALAAFATPLAGLLPLIDMGSGEATGCRAILSETQEAATDGATEQRAD